MNNPTKKVSADEYNLIRRAKDKDADAFEDLMSEKLPYLYKTAKAILHHEEDAADAIQETLLTCWKNIPSLQREEYFKTWMTRILINKCSDLIRKNHDTETLPEWLDMPGTEKGYDQVEWSLVLSEIDERYRMVLILYYIDGLKTSEIAALLDITETAVRSRLSRGRTKLRILLSDTPKSTSPDATSSPSNTAPLRKTVRAPTSAFSTASTLMHPIQKNINYRQGETYS